jgi:hypothetical protein
MDRCLRVPDLGGLKTRAACLLGANARSSRNTLRRCHDDDNDDNDDIRIFF